MTLKYPKVNNKICPVCRQEFQKGDKKSRDHIFARKALLPRNSNQLQSDAPQILLHKKCNSSEKARDEKVLGMCLSLMSPELQERNYKFKHANSQRELVSRFEFEDLPALEASIASFKDPKDAVKSMDAIRSIVECLYLYHYGNLVPEGSTIKPIIPRSRISPILDISPRSTWVTFSNKEENVENFEGALDLLFPHLREREIEEVGDQKGKEVWIRYTHQRPVDNPEISIWVFVFYGEVTFGVIQVPAGHK